jgi:CBS domain containing-hemolysin-like protein
VQFLQESIIGDTDYIQIKRNVSSSDFYTKPADVSNSLAALRHGSVSEKLTVELLGNFLNFLGFAPAREDCA